MDTMHTGAPETPGTTEGPLDVTVARLRRELAEAAVPNPRAFLYMAVGLGSLPDDLRHAREVDTTSWPAPWNRATFVAGLLGDTPVWLVEDLAAEPGTGATPPWQRALPVWVAAASGATVLLHAAAGCLLSKPDAASGRLPASIAVLSDHINVGDLSPLFGLGASRLGPLFPDVSSLHHAPLRRAAVDAGERIGVPVFEAIGACTPGPSLDTPAEHQMLVRLGAVVGVQSLAAPLLAAAHAGLPALSMVCVTDAGESPTDLAALLDSARRASGRLEDLIRALSDELERVNP